MLEISEVVCDLSFYFGGGFTAGHSEVNIGNANSWPQNVMYVAVEKFDGCFMSLLDVKNWNIFKDG